MTKPNLNDAVLINKAINNLIEKYERKLKKEYQRGYDDGVGAEAKVKKGTKRLCSECKKKLVNNS